MPCSWLIGMIKPIYRNKGDTFDPKNYRPITIVSCLGKLFTAILNERLTECSEFFLFKVKTNLASAKDIPLQIICSLCNLFLKF